MVQLFCYYFPQLHNNTTQKGVVMAVNRRLFIRNLLVGAGLITVFPRNLIAGEPCKIMHPLMPPNKNLQGTCDNCGMMRPMWARTWHTFTLAGKNMEVCSMHCLAESSLNSAAAPSDVKAALYLTPEELVPADKAVYVVGSNARGTMSMKSKIAFPSQSEAQKFSQKCGGAVASFEEAYQTAAASIAKENQMINKNRISKGKIVEPENGKDICPVCGMHPARYPKNKCQIQTKSGEVIHFCATQCLFEFLKNPGKYKHPDIQTKVVWVVDYNTGQWIYAKSAYYVIGSNVRGPMGKEAYPFASLNSAKKFSESSSGKIVRYEKVTIDTILI